MGFMKSYKRLDNLCRDMNGIGITGYIEDMEKIKNEYSKTKEWKDDYYTLKHYRYIRNRIAHDTYADEESLCTAKDEEWLELFYDRIINQTDPLYLYYQKISQQNKEKVKNKPDTSNDDETNLILRVFWVIVVLGLGALYNIFN